MQETLMDQHHQRHITTQYGPPHNAHMSEQGWHNDINYSSEVARRLCQRKVLYKNQDQQ